MEMKNKTCLFCLKQRQILVDNLNTASAIKNVYGINLPYGVGRICIECHFNILRVQDFKRTIEAAADFDVDSCFVCKSENTVDEPGVDRVVDYLIKQCTTIDFGNTDTIKACVICIHMLETSIKYEKLAKNYSSAKRFCKQYSTLKECNVALCKIDLNALGEFCERFNNDGSKPPPSQKRGRKRGRSSLGGEYVNPKRSKIDDVPPAKSKQEDDAVLPVMLTKLTPTGGKKSPIFFSKGKSTKQNEKIFIKLPLFSKPKKKLSPKKKSGLTNSPIRSIPASPSVDDLNRIFKVELRPLTVQIEHIDLSTYLNKTISHDLAGRQPRKSRKEEFIGLDEEDLVELQNTSINSSISKRKSILITERTESPNSAKKKVKFSDSPSIKYVDKLDFSDGDDNEETNPNEGNGEERKSTKKMLKPPNGTSPLAPENGKPRSRGRPRKIVESKSDVNNETPQTEQETTDTDVCQKAVKDHSEDAVVTTTALDTTLWEEDGSKATEGSSESAEDTLKETQEVKESTEESNLGSSNDTTEQGQPLEGGKTEPIEDDAVDVSKSNAIAVENGVVEVQKTVTEAQPPVVSEELPSSDVTYVAPMEAEDVDDAEPMKVDQSEDPPTDAEMKPVDSPEDVEMTESKSPSADDVEMKEMDNNSAAKLTDGDTEAPTTDASLVESVVAPEQTEDLNQKSLSADFETSDKEEEEMEKFKLNLSNILGAEISDSDQDASQQSQLNKIPIPSADQQQSDSLAAKEEHQTNPTNAVADATPSVESIQKLSDTESPDDKKPSFSSLDDVDDISDDEGILDELDEPSGERRRSPELPPLGEDSL